MRRAQSVRHYPRPSIAQGGVDDLGILRENEDSEPVEDVLRKQLMDKERECDKVHGFLKYKLSLKFNMNRFFWCY